VKAVAIIPARYASTRLPGKPLLAETGRPLIRHVVEAARACGRLSRVVVATDDDRIRQAVEAFGGEGVMTRADHACGTDRIAEAVSPAKLNLPDDAIVANIQGDEPDLPAECIDKLIDALEAADAPMATLATPLAPEAADDPNKVKVVVARDGAAMYFSRARIPFDRDGAGGLRYLLHVGVYAYRAGFLRVFTRLEPTPAERAEKLEQLRALEHGHRIAVAVVDYPGHGIDTPEDYREFVERWQASHAD
jgi:3-deoxy-manno-octulosonate cytidylyltransferase (CMP-KDO synthetase)